MSLSHFSATVRAVAIFNDIAIVSCVCQTLINFKLEVYPGVELQPMLRTLLTPGDRVPVRFVDRSVADQSLDTSD